MIKNTTSEYRIESLSRYARDKANSYNITDPEEILIFVDRYIARTLWSGIETDDNMAEEIANATMEEIKMEFDNAIERPIHTLDELYDNLSNSSSETLAREMINASQIANRLQTYLASNPDLLLPMNDKEWAHYEEAVSLGQLFATKNRDYGDSFANSFKKYGLVVAALRLDEKLARLDSFVNKSEDEIYHKEETVVDILRDIANYSLMTVNLIKAKQSTEK